MKRSIRSWLLSTLWVSALLLPLVARSQGISVVMQRRYTDCDLKIVQGTVTAAEDSEWVAFPIGADSCRIVNFAGYFTSNLSGTTGRLELGPAWRMSPRFPESGNFEWELPTIGTTIVALPFEIPLGRGCTRISVYNTHATNSLTYTLFCWVSKERD